MSGHLGFPDGLRRDLDSRTRWKALPRSQLAHRTQAGKQSPKVGEKAQF
jgi:hypothetical protein